MHGFKDFIESYADAGYFLAQEPEISPLEAIEDVYDYRKIIKLADFISGASKMILMLKPTLYANIQVANNLRKVLRHPKKSKHWKDLASSVAKTGKLTLANPLVLFPAISPMIAGMEPVKQGIILGALKAISTVYFYITSLASQDISNEKVKEILEKIKPLLPDIYDQHNTKV
jgi:hypothetical protein